MQDSILILVAQEGGAASASERKTRRESTQKARVVTSGRQAGILPSTRRKGFGLEERAWPYLPLQRGSRTQVCPGAHLQHRSARGLERPSKAPIPRCPLQRALTYPVHVCLQFPGCWDRTAGYLPLGRRPCASEPEGSICSH